MTTYYFAATGNDTTGTGTAGNPWKTFAKAIAVAHPGDICTFADGTYALGNGDTVTNVGTASQPIVFQSTNSRGAFFQYNNTANNKMDINGAAYVTIQGFVIDAAQAAPSGATVRIISSNNINFVDCKIQETAGHGIRIPGNATDILIEDCDFDSNSLPNTQRDGIFIVGSNISGITVRNCTIRRVDHTGVNVGDGDNILVEGCTISATRSHGLSCIDGSNVTFRDNYMFGEPGWSGDAANPEGMQIGIFLHGTCENVHVYRNIVNGNSDEGIYCRLNIIGPCYIWNNVFYDCNKLSTNTDNGIIHFYSITSTTPVIQFRNNIIYNTQNKRAMHLENGSNYGNVSFDYNLWYTTQASGDEIRVQTTTYSTFGAYAAVWEPNAVVDDNPDFTDAANDDFSLTTGSPAIDAGVDVGLEYQGNAPDIGAIESGDTGSPPPSGVTGTFLTSGSDSTSGTSAVTASISPSANKLILLAVTLNDITTTPPGTPSSVTGAGLTWVLVGSVNFNVFSASFSKTMSLYRAMSASPSVGAVTINFSTAVEGCSWIISEHGNVDLSGTNGSGAIAQAVTNQEENQTTLDAALAAFASADNATYASFGVDTFNITLNPEAGFTELSDVGFTTSNLDLRHVVSFKATADTSPSYTSSVAVDYAAIALELVQQSEADDPPTCAITNPTDSATVSGTVTVQVQATDDIDAAGTLTVQVSINSGAFQTASWNGGTSRYEYSWDTSLETPGVQTIDARATDSSLNQTNATQITVTIDSPSDDPPTCAITSPADSATVSGTVTVQVQATDDLDASGTLDVDVSINAGAWQTASWNAGTSRYEYSWDTSALSPGVYTIDARATDSAIQTTNATQVDVTIADASNTAPTCAITVPSDSATVSGITTIQVQATDTEDSAGSLTVEVSINSGGWQTAFWNGSNSRYEFNWNTILLSNGAYTIDARATDSGALTTNAAQIDVTVSNSLSPTTIYVKYNNLFQGDIIYLQAGGRLEFMLVTSGPTETTIGGVDGYSYEVVRDLDGTGTTVWYSGEAIVNTRQTGAGMIELYSLESINGRIPSYVFDFDNSLNSYSANLNSESQWSLFPASPAINDAIYFGVDNTIWGNLFFTLGTAGVYTATLVWEFWNGSAWTSFSPSWTDFKSVGVKSIVWDGGSLTNWATTTVNGQSAYWVRVRISAFTSMGTRPVQLGRKVYYEKSQFGPTIVGWIRNSAGFNDLSEHYALGNMNGLYGYSDDTIGLGLGRYSLSTSYITIDETAGIRMMRGSEQLSRWFVDGRMLIGKEAASESNVNITSGGVQLRTNTTVHIDLQSDGDVLIGANTASPNTTGVAIFSAATQSYNGETVTTGDVLIGSSSPTYANLFWDASAKQLKFRGGLTTTLTIDTDGSLTFLTDASTVYNARSINWKSTSSARASIWGYHKSSGTSAVLMIESVSSVNNGALVDLRAQDNAATQYGYLRIAPTSITMFGLSGFTGLIVQTGVKAGTMYTGDTSFWTSAIGHQNFTGFANKWALQQLSTGATKINATGSQDLSLAIEGVAYAKLRAGGTFYASRLSVGYDADINAGDLLATGNFVSRKSNVNYSGRVVVHLPTPIVVFAGATFSTVAASTPIGIGIPTSATGFFYRIGVSDGSGTGRSFFCGPSSTFWYAAGAGTQAAGVLSYNAGFCPIGTGATVWYRTAASGSNTLSVFFEIWGYTI